MGYTFFKINQSVDFCMWIFVDLCGSLWIFVDLCGYNIQSYLPAGRPNHLDMADMQKC
jgi:hypothetical protein